MATSALVRYWPQGWDPAIMDICILHRGHARADCYGYERPGGFVRDAEASWPIPATPGPDAALQQHRHQFLKPAVLGDQTSSGPVLHRARSGSSWSTKGRLYGRAVTDAEIIQSRPSWTSMRSMAGSRCDAAEMALPSTEGVWNGMQPVDRASARRTGTTRMRGWRRKMTACSEGRRTPIRAFPPPRTTRPPRWFTIPAHRPFAEGPGCAASDARPVAAGPGGAVRRRFVHDPHPARRPGLGRGLSEGRRRQGAAAAADPRYRRPG